MVTSLLSPQVPVLDRVGAVPPHRALAPGRHREDGAGQRQHQLAQRHLRGLRGTVGTWEDGTSPQCPWMDPGWSLDAPCMVPWMVPGWFCGHVLLLGSCLPSLGLQSLSRVVHGSETPGHPARGAEGGAAPTPTEMLSHPCRMGSCTGVMPGQTKSNGLTWRRARTGRLSCPATTWTCSPCQSLRNTFTGVIGEVPEGLGALWRVGELVGRW